MAEKGHNSERIDRLIEFFRNLKAKKPKCDQTDYSSWNQTEDEYQKEQAEWLKQVEQKQKNKKKHF